MNDDQAKALIRELEGIAKIYTEKRDAYLETAGQVESEISAVRRRHQGPLKMRLLALTRVEQALRAFVQQNPALFESPQTRTINYVTVGYRKKPDTLGIADEAKTADLIEKNFASMIPILLKKHVTVNKAALKAWDEKHLKQIGVERKAGEEDVVLKDERYKPYANLVDWLNKPPSQTH